MFKIEFNQTIVFLNFINYFVIHQPGGYLLWYKKRKCSERSWGRLKFSLLIIYYNEMLGKEQLLSLDFHTLPLIHIL